MICTFQDRDRKENGRYAQDHIELTSTGDHHRGSQRMNNGSLISGGSDGSTGQSSSRMSQQTDSSGK